MKSNPPVAKCNRCGKNSNNVAEINNTCGAILEMGKYCKGSMRSILKPDDWKECDICGNAGRVDDIRCEACSGSGWINTRK